MSENVDDGDNFGVLSQTLLFLRRNKGPQLVDVDDGSPGCVRFKVEMAHTDLTEVTRMVLIEVSSEIVNTLSEDKSTKYNCELTHRWWC